MPIVMISEIPLPIPRSVICSPSHMTNTVPAVSVSTVISRNPMPGLATAIAPLGPCMLSRKIAIPIPWMIERTTVPYRVYCVIFFRPSSPSFASFSKYGITAWKS